MASKIIYSLDHLCWLFKNKPFVARDDMPKAFFDEFGIKISATGLYKQIKRMGLNHMHCKNGGRFQKGLIPHNKGMKGVCWAPAHTLFKKGQQSVRLREIGSERLDTDGYTSVKVGHPKKWRHKHHLLWEQHNGEIEVGKRVIFIDGNRQNFDIDNLACVSFSVFLRINWNGLWDSPLVQRRGILAASLIEQKMCDLGSKVKFFDTNRYNKKVFNKVK